MLYKDSKQYRLLFLISFVTQVIVQAVLEVLLFVDIENDKSFQAEIC